MTKDLAYYTGAVLTTLPFLRNLRMRLVSQSVFPAKHFQLTLQLIGPFISYDVVEMLGYTWGRIHNTLFSS